MRPLRPDQIMQHQFYGNRHPGFRFPEKLRSPVARLANHSARFQDLLYSFPAILFALATRYGHEEALSRAFSMIESGAPLKDIAKALNIPWWMRKLPPEAFGEAFPEHLPGSDHFSRHIVNLMPAQMQDMSTWLHKVLKAHHLCNEAFALWVAATPLLYTRNDDVNECDPLLELLAAWAWHSHTTQSAAHHLIHILWHPSIGLHKALDAAKAWYNRIKLVIFLGDGGLKDCWLEEGRVLGLDIVPLRTAADFLTEAEMMGNCLDQYADQIRFQRIRVFSIRRDGLPIANIEIGPHEDDRSIPSIEQVRGPQNSRAHPYIWQAAYMWMGCQSFEPRPNGPQWLNSTNDLTTREHPIWAPYRHYLEMRGISLNDLNVFSVEQSESLLLQLEGLALIERD